jgi:hypothetical protein
VHAERQIGRGLDQTERVDLGWIWTANLRPFLEVVGRLVTYKLEDWDWDAVSFGIESTDSERGPWFEWPIGDATVLLALEPGADEMVMVSVRRIDGSARQLLGFAADLMRAYDVRDPDRPEGGSA